MLLAVEGGGFFCSSALGYSKGLALLLLGQKNEEQPMRVSPWNQYQLVNQELDPDLQLASEKNRLVNGCAAFCFGCGAAGLESPSPTPLKVGPTQQQDEAPPGSDKGKGHIHILDLVDNDSDTTKITLRSSLKKPTESIPVPVAVAVANECEELCEKSSNIPCHRKRRNVQWMDASGGELVDIREFELCEYGGSDDEFDNHSQRSCSCRIM